MSPNEHTQQQLWELIYDLLPDEDADALRERIRSDPELARAYATAKLQSELLGKAARLDQAPVPLQLLASELGTASPHDESAGVGRTSRRLTTERDRRRWPVPSALIGLAAVLTIGFFGFTVLRLDPTASRESRSLASTILTSVTLPPQLNSEIDNPVFARATTKSGLPAAAAALEISLYDQAGKLKLRQVRTTGLDGISRLQLPAAKLSKWARLEVTPLDNQAAAVSVEVPVIAPKASTYLSLDKPFYRPGEMVNYRSVTLSKFEHKAADGVDIDYQVRDPAGAELANSRQTKRTERGVGSGAFGLPEIASEGKYSIVAESGHSDEAHYDFFVRRQLQLPRWAKQIEFARDSYSPDDRVVADFQAIDATDGEPAAGLSVSYQVFVDGVAVNGGGQSAAVTNNEGRTRLEFRLPPAISRGDGFVITTAGRGGQSETVAKPIPINLGQVEIDFFPEGGELVAGVLNRVYFHAHDLLGKPVYLEAVVVDDQGPAVAAKTEHEGRGRFSFVPRAGVEYRVEVSRPVGVTASPKFPSVATAKLSLSTGRGVFSAATQLRVKLQSTQRIGPIVVISTCRGTMVGLESIEPSDFVREQHAFAVDRTLQVAPQSGGVLRVTAYDYAASPPEPLAERLVFFRPSRQLSVDIEELQGNYRAGEQVTLSVTTTDEGGAPASSVLGVSVVAESFLGLADIRRPSLPTYFYLTTSIKKPQDLEDADFYVGEDPEAEHALDLLLGTQGWRRFVQPPLKSFAIGGMSGGRGALAGGAPSGTDEFERYAISQESLPLVIEADWSSAESLPPAPAVARWDRRQLRWLGLAAVVASLVLAALIVTDLANQFFGSRWVWRAAFCVGAVSLLSYPLWLQTTRRTTEVASAVQPTAAARQDSFEYTDDAPRREAAAVTEDSMLMMGIEPSSEDKRDSEIAAKSSVAPFDANPASKGTALDAGLPTSPEPSSALDRHRQQSQPDPLPLSAATPPPSLQRQRGTLAEAEEAISPARAPSLARTLKKEETDAADRVTADQNRPLGRTLLVREFPRVLPERLGERLSEETLLWQPLLITDAEGKRTLTFTLPGEARTFRLRVDAHAEGRLGATTALIVVQ